MDRRTATAVLIAVVGILAVGLAAATLTATVTPGSGLGNGGGTETGEGVEPSPTADDRPIDALEVPFLEELVQLLVVLALLAAVGYVVLYWREAVPTLVGIVVIVGLVAVVVAVAWELFEPVGSSPGSMGESVAGGGNGESGTGSGDVTPTVLTLLLVGIALLGVVLAVGRGLVTRSASGARSGGPGGDDDGTAAIGRAAGRAADRIERGDGTENDVYRAWREMTALLEVSEPETTTPREFASAATDAGLAADDVDELTRLFEDVRYGDYNPTTDREQRAVRVFRRIEAQYGADE